MEEFTGMEKDKFEEGTRIVLKIIFITAFWTFLNAHSCDYSMDQNIYKNNFIVRFTAVALRTYLQPLSD